MFGRAQVADTPPLPQWQPLEVLTKGFAWIEG
ncbi:hypothetical protein QFZ71_000394 [Streptomyces sp. V2I9]|nr:hypothetical protein [Streptomyces sp. V2I9]